VRRLFPALVVVLAVALALGLRLFLPQQLASFAKNTIVSALFSANLMLLSETGYFVETPSDGAPEWRALTNVS
jgi:peptidoglycan/LPS O-acetylase OafA/YrhL